MKIIRKNNRPGSIPKYTEYGVRREEVMVVTARDIEILQEKVKQLQNGRTRKDI